jgi:hypothetical protein
MPHLQRKRAYRGPPRLLWSVLIASAALLSLAAFCYVVFLWALLAALRDSAPNADASGQTPLRAYLYLVFGGVVMALLFFPALGLWRIWKGRRRERWASTGRCYWCGLKLLDPGPCPDCGWPIIQK